MTIIRSIKDRSNPYVIINKTVFDDSSLSLKAKGFIGYCLTKPDNWIFYVSQLQTVLKEGEKSIYNAITECIKHGYALRYRKRAKKGGRFEYWQTIISDSKEEIANFLKELEKDPQNEINSTVDSPDRRFGDVDNADVDKSGLLTNDNTSSLTSSSSIDCNNPPPLPPKKTEDPPPKPEPKKSLRSEEEEKIYEILKDEPIPESARKRIARKHTSEEVILALVIAKQQSVKSSFVGLLTNILKNPDDWEVFSNKASHEQQTALKYNEKLAKVRPDMAKSNEKLIFKDILWVLTEQGPEKISLKSHYFSSDIMKANKFLK